jgi:hypothetical protein
LSDTTLSVPFAAHSDVADAPARVADGVGAASGGGVVVGTVNWFVGLGVGAVTDVSAGVFSI